MNDEIVEELVRQIASLEKRLHYIETVEKNVFSTIQFTASTELTISAAEAITVTKSYHTVDTIDDDPTDDLLTINGGSVGDILIIGAASSARTIEVKDGTGNLLLAGDFTMDNTQDTLTLFRYSATYWIELSRSNNAA